MTHDDKKIERRSCRYHHSSAGTASTEHCLVHFLRVTFQKWKARCASEYHVPQRIHYRTTNCRLRLTAGEAYLYLYLAITYLYFPRKMDHDYGIAPTLPTPNLRTVPNSIRPYPDTLSLCGLSRRAHDMLWTLEITPESKKSWMGGKIDITAEKRGK